MEAGIGLLPDRSWEDTAPAVRTALLNLFAFNARSLGQAAFLSEAVRAAQEVPGVAYVDVTRFDGIPDSVTAAELASLGRTIGFRQHVPAELAHLDPKAEPGSPDAILPAELVFMTPEIPETLILSYRSGRNDI
jgi:hypothetical protein